MCESLSVLDQFELRAFEHMGCTKCAVRIREYVEKQLEAGVITLEDVEEIEIVAVDSDDWTHNDV